MVGLALKEPELSPRELAVSFVDQQRYFVSESSVYRRLKARDLITPVVGSATSAKLIDKVFDIENVKSILELRPLLQKA